MKLVINKCYGGFGLSPKAQIEYAKRKFGQTLYFYVQTKYNFKDGEDEYIKMDPDEVVQNFYDVYTVDHGEVFKGRNAEGFFYPDIERNDPILVEVVEELGVGPSSGSYAELSIVEIPDDVNWEIDEYDGMESVRERSRSWY